MDNMFRFCLLFIAFERCFAVSFDLPFVHRITGNQIVPEEKSARLQCVVNFEKSEYKPEVEWVKMKQGGLESIDDLILTDKRFHVHYNYSTITATYTLTIDNVNLKDSGSYLCLVDNNLALSSNTSLLVVPQYHYQVVLEGNDAYLTCFSDYYKFNNVQWLRSNRFPEGCRNSNGSLVIPSSHTSDSGLYNCTANIHYKNIQTVLSTTVELKVVPPLQVKVRNAKLHRTAGKDVNITCLIFSLSSVNVKWTKDYEPLPATIPCHKIKPNIYKNGYAKSIMDQYITTAELQVKNLQEEDFGVYECLVENEYGFAVGTTSLVEHS